VNLSSVRVLSIVAFVAAVSGCVVAPFPEGHQGEGERRSHDQSRERRDDGHGGGRNDNGGGRRD